MSVALTALAFAAAIAGAVLIYLGAPNQRLLIRALPPRPALATGAAACFASLILFLQVMGGAASFFVLLVLLMFVWTSLPFAALLRRRPGTKR